MIDNRSRHYSSNHAFTPPNQFRCSVPRASPQPSVAAPFAVRISPFPQQISLPSPASAFLPSAVSPVSQTGLRARTCGWRTGRFNDNNGDLCCHFLVSLKVINCPPMLKVPKGIKFKSFNTEAPCTFVRSGAYAKGEIRKGKGAPVWTKGREEG